MNAPSVIEKPKPKVAKLQRDRIFTHDLHGFTVDEAHKYVASLVEEAHQFGIGELRIITGKSGRISREFPQWMNTRNFQRIVRGVVSENDGGSYIIYLHTSSTS